MMQHHDENTNVQVLKNIMQEFVAEREWQQFHSPKNLAAKLVIEAGELLEKFVWFENQDSFAELDKNRSEIEDEAADVFIVLLEFCNASKIDLTAAMMKKLQEVKAKYPVEKAKGNCTKYNKL